MATSSNIMNDWVHAMQSVYNTSFEKEFEKQLMENSFNFVPRLYTSSYTFSPKYVEDYVPKQVIFNDRTTVVIWKDNSKTVVRCAEGEKFSEEIGLCEAIVKKVYGGNRSKFLRLVEGAYRQPEPKKKSNRTPSMDEEIEF